MGKHSCDHGTGKHSCNHGTGKHSCDHGTRKFSQDYMLGWMAHDIVSENYRDNYRDKPRTPADEASRVGVVLILWGFVCMLIAGVILAVMNENAPWSDSMAGVVLNMLVFLLITTGLVSLVFFRKLVKWILLLLVLCFCIGLPIVKYNTCHFSYETCWEEQCVNYCFEHTCHYEIFGQEYTIRCQNPIFEKISGRYTYYCKEHTCSAQGCETEKRFNGEYCDWHTCDFPECKRYAMWKENRKYRYCEEHMSTPVCERYGCNELALDSNYCEKHSSENS